MFKKSYYFKSKFTSVQVVLVFQKYLITDQWLQLTDMILNRLFIGSNLLSYVIAIRNVI